MIDEETNDGDAGREGIFERPDGMLEATERTGTGWRTCILPQEDLATVRRILGRNPSTVAEFMAAADALFAHTGEVLTRSRRRWLRWLEMHGTETGAELAARVRENEVL
jgi:hypothetical protein